jgi:ParB family chromosome partitioning protein
VGLRRLVSTWGLYCHSVGHGVDRNHRPDAVVWNSVDGRASLPVLYEVARRVLSRDLGIAQGMFDMDNEGFAVRGNSPLRLEIGADEPIQIMTFGPVRSDHDCAVGALGVSQSDSGETMIGIGVLVDGGLGAGTFNLCLRLAKVNRCGLADLGGKARPKRLGIICINPGTSEAREIATYASRVLMSERDESVSIFAITRPSVSPCELTCPRRSGYNTSLFADVLGDQCLDGACYQTKVAAHIDRELIARPDLVQIETTWRPAKEQRPGILTKHSYRELDVPDNPDAEPPCPSTKSALIVFGRNAGTTITVCTDAHCPLHDPATATRCAQEEAENPAPVMEPAPKEETEEEAEQRRVAFEQQRQEYEAEQQRREEGRQAEQACQQQEREADLKRQERLTKARLVTFDRILAQAPAMFTALQFRTFLRLLVQIDPYSFLEKVATYFAGSDENSQQTDEEVVLAALADTADDKLTGFALRLTLTDHVDNPRGDQPDLLAEAEAAFAPSQPKSFKRKSTIKGKRASSLIKSIQKQSGARKKQAA